MAEAGSPGVQQQHRVRFAPTQEPDTRPEQEQDCTAAGTPLQVFLCAVFDSGSSTSVLYAISKHIKAGTIPCYSEVQLHVVH